MSETLVLNMSTLTWSVVSTVEGRVPLASEVYLLSRYLVLRIIFTWLLIIEFVVIQGMTLVHSNYNGYDYLISFGGYNGRYSNEVTCNFRQCYKLSLVYDSMDNTWNLHLPTLFLYHEQVYTLKLGLKSDSKSTVEEETVSDTTSRVVEPEVETSQDGKIRKIAMDSADSDMVMSCSRYFALLARTVWRFLCRPSHFDCFFISPQIHVLLCMYCRQMDL